ncbi:MAG: cytochrome c oxidase subunit II [Methylobacteriaceae bacterium]|nr:cytochrome c oxidase subunit II [Methylobacteriaceae bacterium]MBV9635394.1 cytochrome c oxidase subunit II [Methylobacteriaceae bacterium]MBV9702354.1 cytochrome c oxidase subunit II [Methylobacteriaceae bacterium]
MIGPLVQSALDPHSPQGERLRDLIWMFTAVCGVVWLAVMIALAIAVWRRRASASPDPPALGRAAELRPTIVVGALVAMTAVTVLVLTGLSYATQKRALGRLPAAGMVLLVTGHQWWWEVEYEDDEPARTFTTANEIHVPVGVPVTIRLRADDVIHSFWVPSLMGKEDLIPGRENSIRFTAARAGIYRGQCAEFCGAQHAHMALLVVAQEKPDFDAWRDGQIRSADDPNEPERQKGLAAFLAKPCVMCHAVRGTSAAARVGPDLTHVGSRMTLAAGTLPLSRGTLAAWLADPQGVKPGSQMPFVQLDPNELNAISAYLEGLK